MDPSTEKTIRQLTQRIEVLERAVGIQQAFPARPAPAPTESKKYVAPTIKRARLAISPEPKRASAPTRSKPLALTPPAPQAESPTKAPARRDLENLLGAAVLGRLGIAAVVLAAGYFAQLAYRHMNDVSKVFALYGLSALFCGLGVWLKKRAPRSYVALMWGGALAIAYIAGVAARLRYDLVSMPVGLLLLVAASFYGLLLAYKLKHKTLATVALAGAFAAPLLVGSTLNKPWFLCAYLLLLHTGSAWFERKWKWESARIVGVVGTILVALVWLNSHGRVDATTYVCSYLYIAGLMAPEWLRAMKGEKPTESQWGAITLLLLIACGALWIYSGLANRMMESTSIAGGVLVLSALAMPRQRFRGVGLQQVFGTIGLLLLAIGTPLLHKSFGVQAISGSVFTTYVAATIGVLAWLLRGRLRLSYAVCGFAVTLAVVAILWKRQATFQLLPGLAAGVPIALLVLARSSTASVYGMLLGLLLLFGYGTHYRQPDSLSLLLALAAVFTSAVMIVGRARRYRLVMNYSAGALVAVCGAWIVLWLKGMFGPTTTKLVSQPSLAAWTIAAITIFNLTVSRAWLRLPRLRPNARAALWLAVVALLYAAVRREVVDWRVYDAASKGLAISCTLGVAAMVLAVFAHLRNARFASGLSLVFLAWAAVRAWLDVSLERSELTSALQLACIAIPVVASTMLMPRIGRALYWLLPSSLVLAGVTWCAVAITQDPTARPLNPVFLSGIGLVSASSVSLLRTRWRSARIDITVVLIFLFAYIVGATELKLHTRNIGDWSRVLMSLYTAIFAGITLAIGFAKRIPAARYLALTGFGLVALKVGLYDLANSPTPLRILVTGGLGAVFLVAAYAYARVGDASSRRRS